MHEPDPLIWKRLKRYEVPGQPRFVTFSCSQRLPLFHRAATKDLFLVHLDRATAAFSVALHAFVVMPEHVHLLVTPDPAGDGIGIFLKSLKARFARRILADWRANRPAAVTALATYGGDAKFWQRGGGFDRNLRREESLADKQAYIEQNPVKRGLAKQPSGYRWSSAWHGG